MINKSFEFKIGVIGLGYVGTPLACLFSKKYDTWGYDIKAEKVAKLAKSTMEDNRPVSKALEQGLKLTSNIDDLKKCNRLPRSDRRGLRSITGIYIRIEVEPEFLCRLLARAHQPGRYCSYH